MPPTAHNKVFVTLTHRTVHAIRVEEGSIVAGGECLLEAKPAVEALLTAVEPSWKSDVAAASASIWPDKSAWHLSSDTEAMLDRTADALKAIAVSSQAGAHGEMAYAACGASDGAAVSPDGMDKWVMASALADDLAAISVALDELKVVSDGAGPAAFCAIDAITSALSRSGKGSVVLWDLGSKHSSLVLVGARGVEGVAPCTIGMGNIYEAVQSALRLKFRGAGERLFFNETYDFSEPGPKIAAALCEAFKASLAKLPSADGASLACIGLTGKQSWFVREMAAACAITAWEPDLAELGAALGLKFTESAPATNFSAFSAAVLGHATPLSRKSSAWRPDWVAVEATEEPVVEEPEPEPAPVVEKPKPAPVVEKPVMAAQPPVRMRPVIAQEAPSPAAPGVPKPAVRPPSVPRPPGPAAPAMSFSTAPAPSAPAPQAPAPAPLPAPAPASARPTVTVPPLPLPPIPGAARPIVTPVAPRAPAPEPSGSTPPMPGLPPAVPLAPEPGAPAMPALPDLPPGAPKTAATVKFSVPGIPAAKSATTAPFEAAKTKNDPDEAAEEDAGEAAQPKSRVGFYITVGVVAALVFAAIAIVLDARMEKAKAYDLEQQEALAHHVAEQRLKEAEVSAKEEAERAHKEMEDAIESTRRQTEDETRRAVLAEVEAERLAKAPGMLLLATAPAGASVSIDGGSPVRSPVRIDSIAPGRHRALISLEGHETVDLPFDIKGSKTTDLGTVSLLSSVGQLDVTSTPDGLAFAVRPSDSPGAAPIRTGNAPASIQDLPHGSYVVTFSRPGCRDHVESVQVNKGGKSSVSTHYLDGALELSSDPSGAWVEKDGIRLGTTPLSLQNLTPKKAEFELTLPGYDPTPVTCDIPEGQTLKVEAQLLRRDRVFKASEVKTKPEAYDSPQPQLSASQRKLGGNVVLDLTVREDGSVSDVEVVQASDDDIARRCVSSVEGWKYHPATAPDDRVVQARIEVSFKFPVGGQ